MSRIRTLLPLPMLLSPDFCCLIQLLAFPSECRIWLRSSACCRSRALTWPCKDCLHAQNVWSHSQRALTEHRQPCNHQYDSQCS